MRRSRVLCTLLLLPLIVIVSSLTIARPATAGTLVSPRRPVALRNRVTDDRITNDRVTRDRTTWDSVFSDAQAARGEAMYGQTCARCHQESLAGADQSPPLTGAGFLSNWNGLPLAELFERVRVDMPSDTPGTYSRQQIIDVLAYVLRFNGFPAGKAELTHDANALAAVRFVASKP